MLFALVLGLLVGGATVLLMEQWLSYGASARRGDSLAGGKRPVRVFTPSGSFIVRGQLSRTFARKRAA